MNSDIQNVIVAGELILDLVQNCESVEIKSNGVIKNPNARVRVQLKGGFPKPRPRDYYHGSFLDRLREAADDARKHEGKPTIEMEAREEVLADFRHQTGPLVETGPDARCPRCGSEKALTTLRMVAFEIPWTGGAPRLAEEPEPVREDEIGTCPDCGRAFSMRA